VAARIPERIRLAVELLAVEPSDRVLEIGCGSGVAASLVCERLDEGWMLAIDRSELQVERAQRRNEEHVFSGRLAVETAALADLDADDAFDKAFAINVNLFWLGPAGQELERIRRALAPDGKLFLVYEPPSAGQIPETAEKVAATLRSGGFTEPEILAPATNVLCCVSRPA
jgi:cyclopropane fatty-acyl-phospholipid synthase-like methyltransferase